MDAMRITRGGAAAAAATIEPLALVEANIDADPTDTDERRAVRTVRCQRSVAGVASVATVAGSTLEYEVLGGRPKLPRLLARRAPAPPMTSEQERGNAAAAGVVPSWPVDGRSEVRWRRIDSSSDAF